MKRICYMIGISLVIISISGCNTRLLPIEQSKINFVKYQSSMESILNSYGYQMEAVFNENIKDEPDSIIRDYKVQINDSVCLYIRIENQNGREAFNIRYRNNISDIKGINKSIDTSLFSDLVNAISGKEITKEYCNEFLHASEEKYPPGKYNSDKREDEIIRKIKALDFSEDWMMRYVLMKDFEETFSIGGLTKQLKD